MTNLKDNKWKVTCGKCGKVFTYMTYHKCSKRRIRKFYPKKTNKTQTILMTVPFLLMIMTIGLFFITPFKIFFLSMFLTTLVTSIVSLGYLIKKKP